MSYRSNDKSLAVAAVTLLIASAAISLPRVLARHAEQKELNRELIAQHAEIVSAQGRIRFLQSETLKLQERLRSRPAPATINAR